MARLTALDRRNLRSSQFVFPESRSFPIPDATHARNALARASSKGTRIQSAVRSKVHREFPSIKMGKI